MRLKEIYIERYGPLNRFRVEFGQGIQPIFGDNESGKTLLVDCVLKMLSGKGVGWDALLDRVAETPEGFLILEEDNKDFKLERGQTLADYLSIGASELRNIFVIRDADLKIPEEDVFYERVTDRVTGLRTEDIRKIIGKLREMGRITEGNDLSDVKALGKPKSKLKEAKRLLEDVKTYSEEAKKRNIPELEAEIFQTKIREESLREKIELLEKARQRDNFINLENKLGEAKNALDALKNKPTDQMISSLQIKLEEQTQKELEKPFLERISHSAKLLGLVSIPSILVAWILSVIVGFINLIELAFPLLLLIIFIFSFGVFCYSSKNLSVIDKGRKKLMEEAEKLGISEGTVTEIKKELDKLQGEVGKLRSSLEQNIGILKNSLAIDEEADEVLKAAEAELSRKRAIIDFDIKMKFNEEELKKADEEIEKVRERLKQLSKGLSEHNELLKTFSNKAHELNFQTFTGKELEIVIENLESLKLLEKELEEFLEKIEGQAKLCRLAIEIFEEMKGEEEAKIEELFKEQSVASRLFREITGDRYVKVFYNSESKAIMATRPSGEMLPASKLSKGTFDQLYMAIRIDLAQRVLGERKGFFIMDDAFISSGPSRFRKALRIIKKLSEMEWSIIYFTVKLEDAKALAKISDNTVIKLKPLP